VALDALSINDDSGPSLLTNSSTALCFCRPANPKRRPKRYNRSIVFLHLIKSNSHLSGCLFQNPTHYRYILGVDLLFHNYILNGMFRSSISLATGNRGYSLSGNLTFRTTISCTKAPAFNIINNLRCHLDRVNNMAETDLLERPPELIHSALDQLRRTFSNRISSPSDIDYHGQTILHISFMMSDSNAAFMSMYISKYLLYPRLPAKFDQRFKTRACNTI
jgi:hypothetical protein